MELWVRGGVGVTLELERDRVTEPGQLHDAVRDGGLPGGHAHHVSDAQLAGRDPVELYERMSAAYGQRLDPCLLDTVMSAVEQAEGGPGRPWWHYTPERRRILAGGDGS